jgi:hypothetical protein
VGGGRSALLRTRPPYPISAAYGRPLEDVIDIPFTGHPKEAAEKLSAYRDAGAGHAIVGIAGGDWRTQVDLLAEVRTLLT